jgi:ABC-type nitrate/sulfonate/bicarbonate transport system substrate-binding protein
MKDKRTIRLVGLGAAALLVVTGCASTATGSGSGTSGGVTKSAGALKLRADGTPDLSGTKISLGIAAGNPVPGDSTNNLLANTLKSWGAQVQYTIGATNSTELAVLSGQLQATDGPLPILVDAGLTIIAPAMTHVDDILVSGSATSVGQLKGKQIGIIASTDPSTYLLEQLQKQQGWSAADVRSVSMQTDSNAVNELISGRIPAAFVASEDLPTLDQHGTFHVVATAAQIAPTYADSFNGATAQWASANPNLVEAIDLAWWHAAYAFDHDTAAWDANALDYTKHASPESVVAAERTALAAFQPWPSDPTQADQVLSSATIQTNYNAANGAGFIKGQGLRPVAQLVDLGPWQSAVAIAKKYPSEY